MEKTYIEESGINRTGEYYEFTQEEIDNLVKNFVKDKTGFDLDLSVGCLNENFDVYVSWDDESDDLIDSFLEYEENNEDPLGLHPEEDFMNRDHIFQRIFGTDVIGYEYKEELETYTLFIYDYIED